MLNLTLLLINFALSSKILLHLIILVELKLKKTNLLCYSSYCGLAIKDKYYFGTELVNTIIGKFEHGKAQEIDGLCVEHLYFCHPVISVILGKVFQLINMLTSHVPAGFRYNTVPIPKPKEYYSKSLTCNDFRCIAISPVLLKVK